MKKFKSIPALVLVVVFAFTGLTFAAGFGAAAVTPEKDYAVADMLTYALQDEHLALAEYQAIVDTYKVSRPFSNIMRAEKQHIAWLLPLFEQYAIEVPEIDASEHIVLPDSLSEIHAAGVQAEENNIAMYETFLADDDLPDDLRDVFLRLLAASENHLRAFSRQTAGVSRNRR